MKSYSCFLYLEEKLCFEHVPLGILHSCVKFFSLWSRFLESCLLNNIIGISPYCQLSQSHCHMFVEFYVPVYGTNFSLDKTVWQ